MSRPQRPPSHSILCASPGYPVCLANFHQTSWRTCLHTVLLGAGWVMGEEPCPLCALAHPESPEALQPLQGPEGRGVDRKSEGHGAAAFSCVNIKSRVSPDPLGQAVCERGRGAIRHKRLRSEGMRRARGGRKERRREEEAGGLCSSQQIRRARPGLGRWRCRKDKLDWTMGVGAVPGDKWRGQRYFQGHR